jgi:DNA-binding NarL/FixJ family response regulator
MTTTKTPSIRVLIADDHGIMRAGLQTLIDSQPDMQVVAQTSHSEEVIPKAQATTPDVAILDVEIPHTSGVVIARQLHTACPKVRILMLSMHDDTALVRSAFEAGATGYVIKEALGDDLLAAIRTVHQGRSYLNVSMADVTGNPGTHPLVPAKGGERLSQREHQVLELLAQGFTNQEIGTQLALSPRTIGTYRARLTDKLGLRTRADIVRYARSAGLVAR